MLASVKRLISPGNFMALLMFSYLLTEFLPETWRFCMSKGESKEPALVDPSAYY